MDRHPEKKEHIFRSKLPDIYIPSHLNLHTYCFEYVSKFRDRPCLIDGVSDQVYTYADVHFTARRVAAGLSKLGIKKGDVIMMLLQNSPQFVYAFLGASYLGAAITTANPFFTAGEITKQAKAANTKLIVTQAAYVDKVKDFSEENNVKIVFTDSSPAGFVNFSDLTSADETEIPEVVIDPDDTVALPFSSGTMGLPKGVILTHKCMVTGVAQQVDGENPSLNFSSSDVILCVLPLFHIYCLSSIMLSGLRVGAAILIMQRFEINRLFELVEKYKVTVAPFVPPIILAIAKNNDNENYDLSSVKVVMSGAAPLGKELEDAVRSKLPNAKLGQGYGMTESASAISLSLAFAKQPFEVKPGACGTVIRNAEMKIIDPETGASLPKNHAGEICIRGNQIMKGYLNDKEATERTIDEEGWLHTGDVGYVDDDDEVFIVDRLKEMIKYKGFQVAPAELEAMLIAHPHISDGAVVSMKDEAAGEVPVAFVVRSNGSNVSEVEIKNYISNQVVFYKRINRVFFVDSIPKSPAGKILRKDLRARFAALPKNNITSF